MCIHPAAAINRTFCNVIPSRLSHLVAPVLLSLMLTTPISAQVVTDLHSFNSIGSSQDPLWVTPTQGRDGKLYGTTGGFNDDGSIVRFQITGQGGQIFAFDGSNGDQPAAGVILGTDGNLYGTTAFGGGFNDGVLFKITPAGAYTVLHEFSGGVDGMFPLASPFQADDGNLYGTTEDASGFTGATVYKYVPSTGTFTTILQLDNTIASEVAAQLIQGSDRNLYGTSYVGGTNGCGSISNSVRRATCSWTIVSPAEPEVPIPSRRLCKPPMEISTGQPNREVSPAKEPSSG
jgi:uncharacterized repeat protein (TIGR03803 family)